MVVTDRMSTGVGPFELVGNQLMGRYSVEERLTRGGMSVVYRGHDDRLQRPVCIKVFFGLDPTRPSYRAVYEHFVQEAFALSQLRHPNTLRIYDFGYLEDKMGTPFQVAEFLEGGTLTGYVRRKRRLTLDETLQILEPVAGALAEAHSYGIIHRDIKPSNILFGRAGPADIIKLADFGIAKATLDSEVARRFPHGAADTAVAAAQGVAFYSLSWAAPEQLRGQPVTPATDVYALGLLAVYMLTGQEVFPEQDMMQTFDMRMQGDDLLERVLGDMDLADSVRDILRKACRDDLSQRYGAVNQLIAGLRDARSAIDWEQNHLQGRRMAVAPSDRNIPVLVVQSLANPEMVAAGRRLRLVEVPREVVLGAGAGFVHSPARIRATLLPQMASDMRLHVKGLNCFTAKNGSRPSSAVDLWEDCDLELTAPDRSKLDLAQVHFGKVEDHARTFTLQAGVLRVPLAVAPLTLVLDYGPGREIILLYQKRGNAL